MCVCVWDRQTETQRDSLIFSPLLSFPFLSFSFRRGGGNLSGEVFMHGNNKPDLYHVMLGAGNPVALQNWVKLEPTTREGVSASPSEEITGRTMKRKRGKSWSYAIIPILEKLKLKCSVTPIQQFAYMPIWLYFIIHIAYMQIRSDIICVKYIVVFI